MEALRQDLRYALRQARRSPGFAAVVVLTLGLGIGANTAVFSVVKGVLLEPLPYEDPDELVALWTRYLPSTGVDIPQFPLSAPELLDYREQTRAFESIAPYRTTEVPLAGAGSGPPAQVPIALLGRGTLETLGVRPALGRGFVEEEQRPDGPTAVLLGHDLWRDRFGGDPEVVGRVVRVDGQPARVVGVMPDGFAFPSDRQRLWLPLGLDETSPPSRGNHFLQAVGRLRAGVGLERAEADRERITAGWNREFEHHASGHFVFLRPLTEDAVGDVEAGLWLVLAAVGLVLLVACANVSNMLLARAESRSREIALRQALGAGRGRLVRQLLTEAGALATLGAALGVGIAALATPAALSIDPTAIPRAGRASVDGAVLAFALVVGVGAALAAALFPALHAAAGSLSTRIASGERTGPSPGGRRLRRWLVGAQVALTVVVVIGAGLVIRSFRALHEVDPGVEARGVLAVDLSLPAGDYEGAEEVGAFYRRLVERVGALPGVRSAATATWIPLGGEPPRVDFLVRGEAAPAPDVPTWNADLVVAEPGVFETLGVPLRAGRAFTSADRADGALVAVVNEALVRKYWPEAGPRGALGKQITYANPASLPDTVPVPWVSVVGVATDTKVEALDEETRPQVFLPASQFSRSLGGAARTRTLLVRATGAAATVAPAVTMAVRELDPGLPIADLRTMEQVVESSIARPELAATLLGGFGLLVLLLAGIGIYGIVSYAVGRRTREIGIRMALGAAPSGVRRLILAEATAPVAAGVVAGTGLALAGSGLLAGLLFGVRPTSPGTYAGVVALLVAWAALSAWWPARRATRIDPAGVLRAE